MTDQKKQAATFAERWKDRGYEKGETASFWSDMLANVFGMANVSDQVRFETRTRDGGFIDAWLPEQGVLIEQKSLGVDLDKPEERQGRLVTPYQQALSYAQQMPLSQQPRWILVSDFATIRVHDRDKADPERDYETVRLSDLSKDMKLLPLNPGITPRTIREKEASIKAGELVGNLHAALSAQYVDPESESSQHALNVLCVRLVFCLYAEDSGLFGKDSLLNYLRPFDAAHMRRAILDLFEVLDTPIAERDPYLSPDLAVFPYVNGGLFRGEVEVPNFTEGIKTLLLLEVSMKTDWSTISPTIFGGVFESTLNPETRRSGGMHYTTVEAIHRLIDPLFLDDLRAEYRSIAENAALGDKDRKSKLLAFQKKIAGLRFADMSCGSGNFLTETYLCLRRLENLVLEDLVNIRGKDRSARQFSENQMALGFSGVDSGESVAVKVNIGQFYGIEVNDFAVRVAKTALWIAELQANAESEYVIQQDIENLPLRDSANIVCGNALDVDWDMWSVDYIVGNPPFIGYSNLSADQKSDRASIMGKRGGTLDYVACWYEKSAQYMEGHPSTRTALVSTNSICQGQQVEPLWGPIFERGFRIDFAWRTFVWNSEASDQAHVHVVIVGFSKVGSSNKAAVLFEEGNPARKVDNINGYLAPAPDVFVTKRSKPLCNIVPMKRGCQPTDGGNLLLDRSDRDELIKKEPQSVEWIRKFSMGAEFIKGQDRWCLWLKDATPKDISSMPLVMERVRRVRELRLQSSKEATRKKADTPWLFDEIREPESTYLGFPKVSSERRRYVPIGFVGDGMIPGDKLYFVSNATLYHFGVLTSVVHNAWMRMVAGRLKSDYSYANTIVYNNFAWPGVTLGNLSVPVEECVAPSVREGIESAAQSVLDARKAHGDCTLADLYDPDNEWLFADLAKAHRKLDEAVLAAYGLPSDIGEEEIVAHLFKLYAELSGGN